MKFLIDAQLPVRLVRELTALGHDVVHTSQLTLGNRTPDDDISELAAQDGRIVITKDSDFIVSFLLFRRPPRLLLISTGNAPNDVLCPLICSNMSALEVTFANHDFIELGFATISIHA